MANELKEKVTPPVREKIARDVQTRVNRTIEEVRQDLDRAGFERKDTDGAIRDGLERSYVGVKK